MLTFVIILVVVIAIFFAVTYNSLTKDKNRIELAEVELRKYEEAGDPKDIDNAKKYYNAVTRSRASRPALWLTCSTSLRCT